MKILVWGGAGFIGSVLVGKLLDYGYTVKVADICLKGTRGLYPYSLHPKFEFEYSDITNEYHVQRTLDDDIDSVILLSGVVGVPACDKEPEYATLVNYRGWANVCNHIEPKVKLIGASTGSVYGVVKDRLCTEDLEPIPLSHYGRTKLAGEKCLTSNGGVALRFATAAGVSNLPRLDLLPNTLVYDALKNKRLEVFEPDNMRTFIDTRDFAESFIHCIKNYHSLAHRVYNVGDENNNWSKRKLALHISKLTGCDLVFVDGQKDPDARDYEVSYERINKEGFKCEYKIRDTLKDLVKFTELMLYAL